MEPSVIAKKHPIPFKGYLWHLFPFLHSLNTQSYYFPQFPHLCDFTSAGEAGENPSLKVSKPEYSMALVWSQSRWQQQDGLLWFLWKWSGTIIMPPLIYCSSPSKAASIFPPQTACIWWSRGTRRVWHWGLPYVTKAASQSSPCRVHITWLKFVYTNRRKPSSMSSWIWLHESSSLTAWSASYYPSFSFEELPKTKWCQFLWWRTLKINAANTFKDYSEKGGIPQGRQMAVFIVQMWQFVIDCAVTHWEWKHIQYLTAPARTHF